MQVSPIPYYTLKASLLSSQGIHNFDCADMKLNILFNSESEFTPQLYTALSLLKNEYMVSLSDSFIQDGMLPALFTKLYLALVLNNFSNRQKLIPVFSRMKQDGVSLHSELEKLQVYLKQQGLYDTKFPVFNYPASGIQTIEDCTLVVMPGQSNGVGKSYPGKNEYGTTLIIASSDEKNDLEAITDVKKQISAAYDKPGISQLYIEKQEFEGERELWRKRTLLYQDFISLSKKVQEKEYYDVLNWYQKEYEVLPVWYKRFGHIIKVIIGKRRLRSLFSDNVKKDKE